MPRVMAFLGGCGIGSGYTNDEEVEYWECKNGKEYWIRYLGG